MSLIDDVQRALNGARAERDSKLINFYSTILSDVMKIAKDNQRLTEDDDVLATVKIWKKNLITLSQKAAEYEDWDRVDAAKVELKLLEEFLPQPLTIEESENIIGGLLMGSSEPNLGMIMKHFRENYNSRYDGAFISQIAREALNA